MRVVDEQRHRLLGPPEQVLQGTLPPFRLARYLDRLLRGQVVEQRKASSSGRLIFALSIDSERDTMTRPSRSRSARSRRDRMVLPEPMAAVSAISRPPT